MPRQTTLPPHTRNAIMGEDYAQNMFQEGHNRTGTDPLAHDAPEYDHAAHTGEANMVGEAPDKDLESTAANPALPTPTDTFNSRDGTDAAGLYDEEGGPLGGTEQELDALEAGGTPVDKNPRMKN